MTAAAKKMSFQMHPQLLWDVITKQAGTLGKALLEGVMNSVDAGASRIELTLTATGFTLTDNGKGFSGEQEVSDFFATFGTPHADGDARFGRFRMGRGQLFSFAKTAWSSNRSSMEVDIKTQGLDFHYRELPEAFPGCRIDGTFYELLTARDVLSATEEVVRNCRYLEIPLLINGAQVNLDPATQKWTHSTEEAYYKLTSGGTSGIAVYQQGVFVETIPAYEFGLSGVIVTRVGHPLRVNFARNQVIRSCPLFKKIIGTVTVKSKEAVAKRATLDDSERDMILSEIKSTACIPQEYLSAKVFQDVNGRYWSARQVARQFHGDKMLTMPDGALAYSVASKGDRSGSNIMAEGRAFVFSADCFEALGGRKANGFASAEWFRDSRHHLFGHGPENHVRFVPLPEIMKHKDTSFTLLEEHQLTTKERLVYDVAQCCMQTLRNSVDEAMGVDRGQNWMEGVRRFRVGVAESADAWTDGSTYIAVSRRFVERLDLCSTTGFLELASLLLHEQCTFSDSFDARPDSPEFYRVYHDASLHGLQYFVGRATVEYRTRLRRKAQAMNKQEALYLAREDEQRTLTEAVTPAEPPAPEASPENN